MSHEFALVVGGGLAIMIVASVFARRTGVAAPLLLVALGIGASYLPGSPAIHVRPELVLAGVLPPLLYASAVQLPVLDLRRNLGLIAWLSVVLVVVGAVLIGLVVHWLFPFVPLPLGVALGAVVSPTDAVAATAIGRRLGLPPRLMTVLEGESLVNDASALVVLRTAIAVLGASTAFHLGQTAMVFLGAVVGAIAVGAVVGWATVLLRQRLDDPVLNTSISFAVPFLAYYPAEELGASGVLAVVVAGLVTGTAGSRRFSARDRQTQTTTWATISFVLESGVFVVMGYQLPELVDDARAETSLGQVTGMVAVVVLALVVIRFAGLAQPLVVARLGLGGRTSEVHANLDRFEEKLAGMEPHGPREETRMQWAWRRLARGRADIAFEEREPLTAGGVVVVAWAGMRGVVTVAAVQTIPTDTPRYATVVLAAYLVALVTLVLFGLTLPALIRRLDFAARPREEKRADLAALLRQVGEDAIDALGPLEDQTVDGEPLGADVVQSLRERVLPRLVGGLDRAQEPRTGSVEQTLVVQRRYVDAMRTALLSERSIGAYSSETYRLAEGMLDTFETRFSTPL